MSNAHRWAGRVLLALVVSGVSAAVCYAANEFPPQKMVPTPPDKLNQLGSTEGMPLYPAEPLAGFPGPTDTVGIAASEAVKELLAVPAH